MGSSDVISLQVPASPEELKKLRIGDAVNLTGTIYTARDAAHKRMDETLERGEELPFDIRGQIVYYMGPSPARPGRPIGSAGPTTATRMDRYTPRLLDLGLSYLSLDRAASTLSTGERQRMQLARAVRNRTTGVLYVLDEPSIGLHPLNIVGLTGVMRDLAADGNSVVFVDHDTQILKQADWLIEMGPGAGAAGGTLIAEGTVTEVAAYPRQVAETALNLAAQGVILCHNHPDGLCEPSPEDMQVTRQLRTLLELLGIRLLDHVIVAGDEACSMAELGMVR